MTPREQLEEIERLRIENVALKRELEVKRLKDENERLKRELQQPEITTVYKDEKLGHIKQCRECAYWDSVSPDSSIDDKFTDLYGGCVQLTNCKGLIHGGRHIITAGDFLCKYWVQRSKTTPWKRPKLVDQQNDVCG